MQRGGVPDYWLLLGAMAIALSTSPAAAQVDTSVAATRKPEKDLLAKPDEAKPKQQTGSDVTPANERRQERVDKRRVPFSLRGGLTFGLDDSGLAYGIIGLIDYYPAPYYGLGFDALYLDYLTLSRSYRQNLSTFGPRFVLRSSVRWFQVALRLGPSLVIKNRTEYNNDGEDCFFSMAPQCITRPDTVKSDTTSYAPGLTVETGLSFHPGWFQVGPALRIEAASEFYTISVGFRVGFAPRF